MPLFVCEKCEVIENTACTGGRYWLAAAKRTKEPAEDWPLLCSECGGGEWHGRFKRKPYDPDQHGPLNPRNRRLIE